MRKLDVFLAGFFTGGILTAIIALVGKSLDGPPLTPERVVGCRGCDRVLEEAKVYRSYGHDNVANDFIKAVEGAP